MSVFLKALDPDDPSANNDVVDDNLTGTDNRDDNHLDALELGNTQLVTDANGERTTTFRVAHQPGDNHRVAATIKPTTQGVPTLDMLNDNNVPPSTTAQNPAATQNQVEFFIGNISPLLTVWRTLYVETDTMARPLLSQTQVVGTVARITPNTPVAGQSLVDLGLNLADDVSDLNEYEGGEILFVACPVGFNTFPVLLSTSNFFDNDKVTIAGVPGACATGSAFTLTDDDEITVLPHFPDFGQLGVEAFAVAYVLPVNAGVAFQTIVGFDRHLDDFSVEHGVGPWNDGCTLQTSASYWACCVVGCWEPGEDEDFDPDPCPPPAVPGSEGKLNGVTDDDAGRSAIFLQIVLSDDPACLATTDEPHTVTHEIVHTSNSHPQHIDQSIMEEGAPRWFDDFAPETIVIIRSETDW